MQSIRQKIKQFQSSSWDISSIIPGLYISDRSFSSEIENLQQYHIKHIIVAGHQLHLKFPENFNYFHLKIRDNQKQELKNHLQGSYMFIKQAISRKQNILVHCAMGISRSASIVIYFLMKQFKTSYPEALSFVKRKRSQVQPNEGFQYQLKKINFKGN